MNDLKALIEQQFIISKLKKEAKLLKRENPQLSLMQCQDKIAQQHGYLHWHELYVLIKRKLTLLNNHNCIAFIKHHNNISLGYDNVLNKDIYLARNFHKIHIKPNEYSQDLNLHLFKEIMEQQCKFIYCHGKDDTDFVQKVSEYANIKNIPVYHLSFNGKNNTLGINFNGIGSGAMTEIFIKLVLEDEDNDADIWAQRAISMASCLFMALVYLRDKGEIKLTPEVIYEHLILEKFITLYKRKDLPSYTHAALKSYLHSLSQLDEIVDNCDTTPIFSDSMLENHGYLQMQFSKVLGMMIHNYPQVFNDKKTSLLEVLHKREKFVLIVDLATQYSCDVRKLFSAFYCMFIQSFVATFYDKELLNYPYYLLLTDIDANRHLPTKFLTSSVNFISNNEQDTDVLSINPTKDGISL